MHNKLVDAYIEKQGEFAQPILHYLRELVHEANAEIEEKIKWGMPSFEFKGLMCGMAAFKNHCAFGFWKQKIMPDPYKIFAETDSANGMLSLGKITTLEDLPSKEILIEYIITASKLNAAGVKIPSKEPRKFDKKELVIPDYILEVLSKNNKAKTVFEKFPPSHKKEYIEWIVDAKRDETKNKRIAQMLEWLEEGKDRNWAYRK